MGVFTQIEVQVQFATDEDSEKAFEIMENFEAEIKKHIYKDKPFYVNKLDFEGDDSEAYIKIHSGREPNARFHVDCLIKLFQIHKVRVDSFNADIIQPDTYLYFEGEDFDEHEINFED